MITRLPHHLPRAWSLDPYAPPRKNLERQAMQPNRRPSAFMGPRDKPWEDDHGGWRGKAITLNESARRPQFDATTVGAAVVGQPSNTPTFTALMVVILIAARAFIEAAPTPVNRSMRRPLMAPPTSEAYQ